MFIASLQSIERVAVIDLFYIGNISIPNCEKVNMKNFHRPPLVDVNVISPRKYYPIEFCNLSRG